MRVWDSAHQLTLELYRATLKFPREELYGVTTQLRRAASSIGANLAEGCGRQTGGELARFVRIAMGSASELEYHLLLARDLGYLDDALWKKLQAQLTSVRKMLASLLQAVEGGEVTNVPGKKRVAAGAGK